MLSVILPAYNEGYVIGDTLRQLTDSLDASLADFEILVVDDGSDDNTAEVVRGLMRSEPRINLISYQPNHGKGYAVHRGFDESSGAFIALFDADLDIPPQCILGLYTMLLDSPHDGVIGSKVHRESSTTDISFNRRLITKSTNLLVRLLFRLPFRDTQVGVKVFRKRVIDAVRPHLITNGFTADIELLYWAHQKGFTIVDGPVTIKQFTSNSSVNIRAIMTATVEIFTLFFRTRISQFIGGRNAA